MPDFCDFLVGVDEICDDLFPLVVQPGGFLLETIYKGCPLFGELDEVDEGGEVCAGAFWVGEGEVL